MRDYEEEQGDDYILDLKSAQIIFSTFIRSLNSLIHDDDILIFTLTLGEYNLHNEDEKYDIVPEIYEGKNIADFIDPEIMQVCRSHRKLRVHHIYNLL